MVGLKHVNIEPMFLLLGDRNEVMNNCFTSKKVFMVIVVRSPRGDTKLGISVKKHNFKHALALPELLQKLFNNVGCVQ